MELICEKKKVRSRILAARDSMTREEHEDRSSKIRNHLLQLSMFRHRRARTLSVAAFAPFRSEVNIWPFLHRLWQEGVHVWLPKVEETTGDMQLYKTTSVYDLREGKWGIQEPNEELPQWDERVQLDVMIIPGVAFDLQGGRLGYGAGYYDRLFARMKDAQEQKNTNFPPLIAPAFSVQVIDKVPCEAHDQKIDGIVTEDYSQFC